MSENSGRPVGPGVRIVDIILIALVVIPALGCCVWAMMMGS